MCLTQQDIWAVNTVTRLSFLLLAAALGLSACAAPTPGTGPLPEEVAAMAGPNQDLASARLLPEDNCYWYAHKGQVETTLLPLRTPAGNPICMARSE